MNGNDRPVFRMTLYDADCIEKPKNTLYPHEISIVTEDDMLRALRRDHMASKMRNSRRGDGNFLYCDCIMADIDNTHSEDPDAWKTADDISEALPVNYVLSRSRNYMKEKRRTDKAGKVTIYEPREKWHVYFPLANPIATKPEFDQVMHHIQALFPFIDSSAKDAARFFFGVKDPHITVEKGGICIDDFLAGADPGELRRLEQSALAEFVENVQSGTYKDDDSTRATVASVCGFLGMKNPLDPTATVTQGPEPAPGDPPEWIRRADQEKAVEWLERWADRCGVSLGRRYRFNNEKHPDALAICVTCPWEDEHSEDGPENEAVIIVELSGKYNFLCRHTHGGRMSWKKYRAKVEAEAGIEDITIMAGGVPVPITGDPTATAGGDPVPITSDQIQEGSTPPGEFEAIQISRRGLQNVFLVLTEQNKVASRFCNYTEIMQKDAYLAGKLSFNTLTGRHTITGVWWDLDEHAIRDNDLYHIREHISKVYGIQNKDDVRQAVEMTAEKFPFNPIERELNSLSWDGVPRIGELFPRFLGAERSRYTEAVTLTMLHGAIRRALSPGIKYDYCIILADSKQGTGKSTLCRFLALRDEWFCDSLGDLAETDKAFETVRGHWICELGELLATRRTKDIEATKAYLTRQSDLYREKYHLYAESHPRRCIFIGTTNNIAFLPADMTGNRRFIPLKCNGDLQEVHPLDDEEGTRDYIRQCYAEAMARGIRDGWQLILPKECAEELAAQQEEATPEDPRIGMIQEFLDTTRAKEQDGPDNLAKYEPLKYVCIEMIREIVFHGSVKPHERRDIANILSLKIKGWKRYQGKDGKSKSCRHRFRGSLAAPDATGLMDIYYLEKYGNQRAWIREEKSEDSCVPSCIPSCIHKDGFVSVSADTSGGNAAEEIPFD